MQRCMKLDTYHDHGQEDEAGGGRLSRTALGVDEGIDRRGDENHATGEVARDGDVVGMDGIAGDDDEDADYEEQAIDDGPPGKGGEAVVAGGLYLRNDAGNEGDEPSELGRDRSAGRIAGGRMAGRRRERPINLLGRCRWWPGQRGRRGCCPAGRPCGHRTANFPFSLATESARSRRGA